MSHFDRWPWPRVLAHRGAGTLAPENTIAALRVGLAHGYRAVEFDAMAPADDVAILMHDPMLERTVRRQGRIIDQPAAELTRLDAGGWHSPRFIGERIPSLGEALRFCRANGIWVNVEIKPVPGHEERTGAVVARECAAAYADALEREPDGGSRFDLRAPLLSSFSTVALEAARAAVPGLARGLLVDRLPRNWRDEVERLDCVSVHASHRHLHRADAERIKRDGYWLFCYTVNEPNRARELLNWGVDAFCTDRIDLIPADLAPPP